MKIVINNKSLRRLLIFATLAISTAFVAKGQKQKPATDKPNVIYILADDMGAGMLSYYGQKFFSTPNIDRVAHEGVIFDNSYSSTYCAPSRATFLTGYSDCREGKYVLTNAGIYTQTATGKLSDKEVQQAVNDAIGKEPDVQYLPQVFQQAGYVTGQVGKLDYGFATSSKQMDNHGWDYHYGYYDHVQCHGFYPMFLHENGKRFNIPGNTHPDAAKEGESGSDSIQERKRWDKNGKQVYSQDLFLQKMLEFIRENRDRPFFLYHPTQLPHGPVSIPAIHPELAFDNELTDIEKAYASMVKRLDDDLGVIQQELERLGLAENTIIVFTSDNGHHLYTTFEGRVSKANLNLQTGERFDNINTKYYSALGGDIFDGNNGMAGMKMSNWNGGIKVPLFVSWPAKFKQGFSSKRLVTNYDFIATMADLLQVPLKEKKDGLSYLNELQSGATSKQEERTVAFSSFMGPTIISSDGWKLRYYQPKKIYQLYYIPDDFKEQHELSAKEPEKAKELKAQLLKMCDGNLENGMISNSRFARPVVPK